MIRTILGLLFLVVTTTFAQQAKQLAFREETHDFGTIDETKGPVKHEFVFTNNSARPVKILKVQASCGCTTPGWSKEVIPPGRTGYIQASYDPKGRPGFFTKSLTVTTDLEANPIILQIKGQVNNEEKPSPSDYPVANGRLKMKASAFSMGRVYLKDEYVVREFPVINGGDAVLNFTGKFEHPSYIRVDVQPRTLPPGEKAMIKVSYNGALKNQYGFQSDNIGIETDDSENPLKSFSVYATLEDFFPEMTAAELAKAPQLNLASTSLDFGNVKTNTDTEMDIQFTNTGKKVLTLKSIQPNCTCITATARKSTLKPGESSTIHISFNPMDRIGTQNKAITLYSNDPRNPVQRLTFTAYVQ
ncbi:MAG TPA: DUF1573 domain-containing protein [Chryseosolibacter sp.]|nr:DUF1573 domain-containing protein [Chryseosolibacter sp.]